MARNEAQGKNGRLAKILRRTAWVVSGIAAASALLATAVFLLVPYALSAPWFRSFVESYASRAFQRSLFIETMSFDWEEGLRIKSIRLMDDPAVNGEPMASIGALRITLDFKKLFLKSRFDADVTLDTVKVRVVREEKGKTNFEHLFAERPSGKNAPFDDPVGKRALPAIPISDYGIHCRIRNLEIHYLDRNRNRDARLHQAFLNLHAPSLFHKPLEFSASARIQSGQNAFPPLSASLKVKDLFDASGSLRPENLSVDLEVFAPGIQVELKGALSQKNLRGTCRADLGKLLPPLFSLFPETRFPEIRSGRLELSLSASQIDAQRSAFQMALEVEKVELSPPFPSKPMGPLTLALTQKGTVSIAKGDLSLEQAVLSLNSSRIAWKGDLAGLRSSNPEMRLTFGPSRLILPELVDTGSSLQAFPRVLEFEDSSSPSSLEIEEAVLWGHPLAGLLSLNLKGLTCVLERFRFFMPEASSHAAASTLKFFIPRLEGRIKDFFPVALSSDGSVDLRNLKLGNNILSIGSLRIPSFRLDTHKPQVNPKAPFGFTLPFFLTASLSATDIKALDLEPSRLAVDALEMKGSFASQNLFEGALKGIHLKIPGFSWNKSQGGKIRADLELEADAPHLRIRSLSPLRGDFDRLRLHLFSGPGLQMMLKADAADSGRGGFNAEASFDADLGQLRDLFPVLLNEPRQLHGKAFGKCRLSGRLSETGEAKRSPIPSSLFPERLILDSVQLSLELARAGLTWPLGNGTLLSLEGVTTPKPLAYVLEGDKNLGSFKGDLRFETILPKAFQGKDPAHPAAPSAFHLTVSGQHDGLKSVSLSTVLDMTLPAVRGEAEFFFDGIEALVKSAAWKSPETWDRLPGGTARLKITLPESSRLRLGPETSVQGGFEAGTEIKTSPDQGIHLRLWANTEHLDIEKEKAFFIQNLHAALSLEKRYRTRTTLKAEKPATELLSDSVIQEGGFRKPKKPESDTLSTLTARVQAQLAGKPSFFFGPARFHLSPHEIPVRHVAADLHFEEGLPHFRHMEAHLLGGSCLGSAKLLRHDGHFNLQTQLVFSDIDLGQVWRKQKTGLGKEDSAVSGQLKIAFPLVSNPNRLLENLRLDLQFNRIGPEAFGRILYLLDPYESNETIVSQRRLLRNGTPRWIDLDVQNGILSLDGEVAVKGISVKIPPLERLNVAAISGLNVYERRLKTLELLARFLDLVSSPSPPLAIGKNPERKR